MAKEIFIWVGHPQKASLNEALADAYQSGVESQGAVVRRQNLSDMRFDAGIGGYGGASSALEPDLVAWQENVEWADHLAIFHPYWWGSMPAKAKAVIDRALTPGFAFKYHEKGMGWDKLLSGRTADLMLTSDTPPWYDTLSNHARGRKVMQNQILGFCGIKTRKISQIGSVSQADDAKINGWIAQAKTMGIQAAG